SCRERWTTPASIRCCEKTTRREDAVAPSRSHDARRHAGAVAPPAQRSLVHPAYLADGPVPTEQRVDASAIVPASYHAPLGRAEVVENGADELGGAAQITDAGARTGSHDFGQRALARDDDRKGGRHGLADRQAEALERRGRHEDVGQTVDGRLVGLT